MSRPFIWSLFLSLVLVLSLALPVQADGIIFPPEPPPCRGGCPPLPHPMAQLVVRYHHVTVTIQNQLAVTHVDQVFYNPNEWAVEGVYIFPLPVEAVVSNFTLWIDGKPVKGDILSADQARSIYEETVNKLRDPALLEYEGRGAVKASVFPIPPQGERRIELEYSQALTAENGLVRYVYPLNTEKFSQQPLQDVSVQVDIQDHQAIRAVYSPSHPIDQDKKDDHHISVGYEAKDITPDADFTLYYSLGDGEAFHLFTYRDPQDTSDPDGFFLALVAPKPDVSNESIAKDVLLVLDRSGSMDGEKFTQAQAALKFILNHLHSNDRFHLLAFSTGVEAFREGLSPASDAAAAVDWVDHLEAAGSTDINRALLEAASVMDKARPTYLIFLTDGLPTEGVQDPQQIAVNFAKAAPGSLRLFAFGVGNDVDTVLLDTLSQEHHGTSTYVRPGEAIDEILSSFYERISSPVLTDLKLDFGGISTFDVYPDPLPDLFRGSQVIIIGRYHAGGVADIVLKGQVNGEPQSFTFPAQSFTNDNSAGDVSLDMLPRLWATRKIGYLLNEVRLNGPDKETIDQIVKLSIRYGIITKYTSYLVSEPSPLGQENQDQISSQALKAAQNAPAPSTGEGAVDRASQEGALQSANSAPQPAVSQESGQAIKIVGARTFWLSGSVWTDTRYDPQSTPTQKIAFLSPEYFQLIKARPDLAPALALGEQVIVVVDGGAYQVVAQGESTGPVHLPTPQLPTGEPASTISPTGEVVPIQTEPAKGSPTNTPASAPDVSQLPHTPPATCLGISLPIGLAAWFSFRVKRKGNY